MKKNLIYGIRPIIEAIESGESIDKLFVQKGLRGQLSHALLKILKEKGINYHNVPVEKLNRLTKENHQGAVAYISPIKIYKLDELLEKTFQNDKFNTYLLLDGITDPRNFGAIIRTAAATNVSGIIVSENASAPINEDTVKTSAGGIFSVPIAKAKHLKDAIYALKAVDVQVFAATEKAKNLVYDANLNQSVAFIMGSEGRGINPSVLKIADYQFKLPMLGKIDSLNVSVACGVMLYESLRQKI